MSLPEFEWSHAVEIVAGRMRQLSNPVLLIDGPSGAGKSTFADALVHALDGRPVLVRLEDIYPGWNGLAAAGAHVERFVLEPRSRGASARWQRHDWNRDSPAEWHSVPADRPLVIEGCGSMTRRNASLADVRVWLDAPHEIRKIRALARDDGAFDDHWDSWQAQVDAFIGAEQPLSSADLVFQIE